MILVSHVPHSLNDFIVSKSLTMPLLHKKPFIPVEYPMDLKEVDEVFVCHSTNEIFKDYDDFCERIILCNSLVWSCSLTGRSHLTYQEAAASEEKIKRLLKRFPMELREPVLYLSSICERRSLVELAEEVFSFVKDRYFIGETVEVEFPDGQVSCNVLAVIPPTEQELEVLKGKKTEKDERHFPPSSSYKYEVERMDNNEEKTVTSVQMFRKKSAYTKDKNRLYIKQFVFNDQGVWKLKESTNTKYGISNIKFHHMFCGNPPDMNPKKPISKRKSTPDKPKKQETINKYFKSSPKKYGLSPRKTPKKGESSSVDMKKARKRRRSKKEVEDDKKVEEALKLEMKLKKKALLSETRAKYNEFVKEWNMKREDLECEDLEELPSPHPVHTSVPDEHFGDVAMFMEFFNSFNKLLDIKDFFPHGITLGLLERALLEKEVAGPLSDLLQLLLCRILGLIEGEMEEIKQADMKNNQTVTVGLTNPDSMKLTRLATQTDLWVKKYHAMPLAQLQLDTSTISEMLRLHLLASGAVTKGREGRWRYQARGGYCSSDDPGIQFRADRPDIIDKLGCQSVFELDIADKIDILNCLMTQILTYSATRDIIDEGCEKGKQQKVELRALRAEQSRKEKEEAIRLKDLKKAGLLTGNQKPEEDDKDNEAESTRERELRSGITGEKKATIQILIHEINDVLRSVQMTPLGTDRAFRRYWLFPSIPGLFVEDNDPFRGPCLPKCTPIAVFNSEDRSAYIKRLFKESSNKENISDKKENIVSPSPKKLLVENNGGSAPISRNRTKSETQSLRPLTCWADPENCPVHGSNINRPKWSYIQDANEVERLIQSLNKRGVRERRLREALVDEKETIVNVLENFPVHLFSSADDSEISSEDKLRSHKVMKAYDGSNLGYPDGTPIAEIIEGSLRDLILETEEKISAGALGYLKVKDREVWRDAIANNSYDRQCKMFIWGLNKAAGGGVVEEPNDVEEMDVDDKDETDSRCSTPSVEVSNNVEVSRQFKHYPKGFVPVPQRQVVLDLASAIVQVEQSIEHKFLKRPLGLDQKQRERGDMRMPTPEMERWENALMESTSFAQLFLHLSTLENSVIWARSALNAFCRICRRRGDPENMLLCDTCNKGHHMYCLKPKLTKVPTGDWFCAQCKPTDKITSKKKKRRMFSEDSDSEESETDTCSACKEEGAQLACDTCNVKLHIQCVNPPVRKVPKSKWFCHDCRAQNAAAATMKKEPSADSIKNEEPASKTDNAKSKKEMSPAVGNAKGKSDKQKSLQSRIKPERRSLLVNGRELDHDSAPEPSNGYVEEVDRLSRRKCSKAATAKISQFAKQLRSSQWAENGEVDENEFVREESRSKRSRRSLESTKKARDLPLDNAALQEILETLMHHKDAWPFLRPVTKSEVPDYHLIIKKPMDFATIKHKLNMLEYTKNSELIADAELLFQNCSLYNQEGSEVFKAGETLQQLFYKLCQEHNLQYNGESSDEPLSKKSRSVL